MRKAGLKSYLVGTNFFSARLLAKIAKIIEKISDFRQLVLGCIIRS